MIELDENVVNFLDIGYNISLDDLLSKYFDGRGSSYHPEEDRNAQGVGISYNRFTSKLTVSARTGNKLLFSHHLFCYPDLMKALRKIGGYPYFSAEIFLNKHLPNLKGEGLQAVRKNIDLLIDVLESHKKIKSEIDCKVNNLIKLYGKEKKSFKYHGGSQYDFSKELNGDKRYSHRSYYKIQLSRVPYFNNAPEIVFQDKEQLHVIATTHLLRDILNPCDNAAYKHLFSYYSQYDLIGGIIDTPILIFNIKKDWNHKGKKYYINCYTHDVSSTLAGVKKMAAPYIGKRFIIDIFHHDYKK